MYVFFSSIPPLVYWTLCGLPANLKMIGVLRIQEHLGGEWRKEIIGFKEVLLEKEMANDKLCSYCLHGFFFNFVSLSFPMIRCVSIRAPVYTFRKTRIFHRISHIFQILSIIFSFYGTGFFIFFFLSASITCRTGQPRGKSRTRTSHSIHSITLADYLNKPFLICVRCSSIWWWLYNRSVQHGFFVCIIIRYIAWSVCVYVCNWFDILLFSPFLSLSLASISVECSAVAFYGSCPG